MNRKYQIEQGHRAAAILRTYYSLMLNNRIVLTRLYVNQLPVRYAISWSVWCNKGEASG